MINFKHFNLKPLIITLLTFFLVIILLGCNTNTSSDNQSENQQEESSDDPIESTVLETPTWLEELSMMGPSIQASILDEQYDTTLVNPISIYQSITITEPGNYVLSGTIEGRIRIESSDVKLFFNNVSLTNYGEKVIDSKYDLTITLIQDTSNTITNQIDNASTANAISIEGDLTINGSGNLIIDSTRSAIKVDETYYGLGGSITLTAYDGHGINADTIIILNQNINITYASKDGLHAETDDDILLVDPTFNLNRGFVYIGMNTSLIVQIAYGDGIQADTFVLIDDGLIIINTFPTFEAATSTNGVYRYENGEYTRVGSDSVYSYSGLYQLSNSSKGIKVGEIDYEDDQDEYIITESANYALIINGGLITINSTDDGLHVNSGSLLISGGDITINTSDDGIAADLYAEISNGSIHILSSYEGIESETINITGGVININASDDGMNASNDLTTALERTTTSINISGGVIYINAGGDGVDSNGVLNISGGELYIASIDATRGDGALDSETGIIITGGTVITFGLNSNSQNPSSSSSQLSIVINQTNPVSGVLEVNQNGEVIISFNPANITSSIIEYQNIIISSPLLELGETYTITFGDDTIEVTLTSVVTTVGTSSTRW